VFFAVSRPTGGEVILKMVSIRPPPPASGYSTIWKHLKIKTVRWLVIYVVYYKGMKSWPGIAPDEF
jgi:hypothetical protein